LKLIAMVMVGPGEADRYLEPLLWHLGEFCDEIRVRAEDAMVDPRDGDAPVEILHAQPTFFHHEGQARQELLDWAMEGKPTHLLAIDADEFVADGQKLRASMEAGEQAIWKLDMTEIWGADEQALEVRIDGLWPPRPVGMAFTVPEDHFTNRQNRRRWRIPDSQGACGRVPLLTAMLSNRTRVPSTTQVLHFGWACKADRPARYSRYADREGFGHAAKHIKSIMYGDDQVALARIAWPEALDKETLLERVNRT
jgi:hypothetical protein